MLLLTLCKKFIIRTESFHLPRHLDYHTAPFLRLIYDVYIGKISICKRHGTVGRPTLVLLILLATSRNHNADRPM